MQIIQGVKKVLVTEAILHCAAVHSGWAFRRTNEEMLDDIRDWHVKKPPAGRGWSDIGYHYVITPAGVVLQGRPFHIPGAGVIGRNYGFLQILMVESYRIDRIGKFSDFFTEAQKRSVRWLVNLHQIKVVSGHNDWANKLCPGFKVRAQDFVGYP